LDIFYKALDKLGKARQMYQRAQGRARKAIYLDSWVKEEEEEEEE
jgi:hypothetical protein